MKKGIINNLRLTPDIIFQADHLKDGLAQKSMRGGIATMLGQGGQFVLGMVGTVVLARLLTPGDYGLVGMVAVITGFITMFSNAGLSMATIRNESINPEQISTLFWINTWISVGLGLLLIVGSPIIARFYGRPELTGLTAVLSLSFIVSGSGIQHQALLYRHMRFNVLAGIQLTSLIANLIVAITLAWLGFRYWALAWGQVINVVFNTVLVFYFCPWTPRSYKGIAGARGMLSFGGHLTVSNVANYISGNMDNVLVGKYIGANGLGLYAKAYQLFFLSIRQLKEPLQNSILPALSSLGGQPERYRKYYLRFLDLLATLTIPIAFYSILESDFLVGFFLGSQWVNAIPVVRIFAILALIYPLAGTQSLVLVSLGESRKFLWWGTLTAIFSVISFVVGLPFGITGVAGAFTLMNYLTLIPSLYYCLHRTPVTVKLFFKTILPSLLLGLLAMAGAFLVRLAAWSDSVTIHLAVAVVFAVIYGGLSLFRKSLRDSFNLIKADIPIFRKQRENKIVG